MAMWRSFVEISKRGIWSPQRIAQERLDVHYRLLAIDFLPAAVLHSAMQRLAGTLASSPAQSLPLTRHGLSAASSALRQLSQVIMLKPAWGGGVPLPYATCKPTILGCCVHLGLAFLSFAANVLSTTSKCSMRCMAGQARGQGGGWRT